MKSIQDDGLVHIQSGYLRISLLIQILLAIANLDLIWTARVAYVSNENDEPKPVPPPKLFVQTRFRSTIVPSEAG